MNKNYQKIMKNDKKIDLKIEKNPRHSPFQNLSFFIDFLSFALSFSKETEENE